MAFIVPYRQRDITHLVAGTHIRALITYVHNKQNLEFTIRLISLAEFRLTDMLENWQYPLEGFNVLPSDLVFGLGINGKIFRAILWPLSRNAYLIDLGYTMPIRPTDPIYRLPIVIQAIPGVAIFCQYADNFNPYCQPQKWLLLQDRIRQGEVCSLRVVGNMNSILQVRFAS